MRSAGPTAPPRPIPDRAPDTIVEFGGPALGGADISTVRGHEPAPCRSAGRAQRRLRSSHPARPGDVRNRRLGGGQAIARRTAEGLVELAGRFSAPGFPRRHAQIEPGAMAVASLRATAVERDKLVFNNAGRCWHERHTDHGPSGARSRKRSALRRDRFDDDYWLDLDRKHEFLMPIAMPWRRAAGSVSRCPSSAAAPDWHHRGRADDADDLVERGRDGGVFRDAMNVFGAHPIVVHGTDEQRERMLTPIIRGEDAAGVRRHRARRRAGYQPHRRNARRTRRRPLHRQRPQGRRLHRAARKHHFAARAHDADRAMQAADDGLCCRHRLIAGISRTGDREARPRRRRSEFDIL